MMNKAKNIQNNPEISQSLINEAYRLGARDLYLSIMLLGSLMSLADKLVPLMR